MSLTVPRGLEPARNSLPGSGWYPGAPRVGTQLSGIGVPNPISGAQGTKFTEYAYEDYATSAFAPVVTAINFVPANNLHIPVPDADANAAAWKRVAQTYEQYLSKEDGVIATKGELIWVYRGSEPKPQSTLEEQRMAYLVPHTYDYTSESTQGFTLPAINKFFRHMSTARGGLPDGWYRDQLRAFCDQLHFLGVVDSVGPGQSMKTDRVRKNYVCVVSRLVHGVADVWHADPVVRRGGALAMGGFPAPRNSNHRPAAALYVTLVGLVAANPVGVNVVTNIEMLPRVFISQYEAHRSIRNALPDGREVIEVWYIGTYRSPNGNGTNMSSANVLEYVRGNAKMQNAVPQCEISVDC